MNKWSYLTNYYTHRHHTWYQGTKQKATFNDIKPFWSWLKVKGQTQVQRSKTLRCLRSLNASCLELKFFKVKVFIAECWTIFSTRRHSPNESPKAVIIDMMKSVGEIASKIWPVVYYLTKFGEILTLTFGQRHRHLGHRMCNYALYLWYQVWRL